MFVSSEQLGIRNSRWVVNKYSTNGGQCTGKNVVRWTCFIEGMSSVVEEHSRKEEVCIIEMILLRYSSLWEDKNSTNTNS